MEAEVIKDNSALNEYDSLINESSLLSRDLSWLKFNYRVLEQAKRDYRTVWERLKFIAITASNLDEFMMIRVGSLYNYLDFDRHRIDYSGLREWAFKEKLFFELQKFVKEQNNYFQKTLTPLFKENNFSIIEYADLTEVESKKLDRYFSRVIYPMLTPMMYDKLHPFPSLGNQNLALGVVTCTGEPKEKYKFSFVQVPRNLPRFVEIERDQELCFLPVEELVKANLYKLYSNVEIQSISLFRLTRNGDFDYDDYDEGEVDFIEEVQRKLKKRKTGRVVRLEVQSDCSSKLLKLFKKRFKIEKDNVFELKGILDYTGLWQIVGHSRFSDKIPKAEKPVYPLLGGKHMYDNLLEYVTKTDLFLHHPYNSMYTTVRLLEEAAEDPDVLAIKITIYRLAKESRISQALLKAAENGKHVSVLFEVKARFDEENNIQEGRKLQRAGCFVVYGIQEVKTHTKLMLIVKKQKSSTVTITHLSSGNYNESTAKIYEDTALITSNRTYGNDVAAFFNVITGHSQPPNYKKLITTPGDMRKKLISLIRKEANNAKKGLASGIIIKVNSLEDKFLIEELYKASKVGVEIKLIVRGICCLRPGREGLSENIYVKSIVGEYLEHSRLYYFHNAGDYKIYGGSADVMVRSFDRRIESLFLIEGLAKKEALNSLIYSLKDQMNSFELQENGEFVAVKRPKDAFNCHSEFFKVTREIVEAVESPF